MKSTLRFLAAFGVAAALLGGGCAPKATPPTPPVIQQEVGGSASKSIDIASVTTKKGKTDSLRNLSIASADGNSIMSPLEVSGEARLWYFEGSFPIHLMNASGRMIASGIAQAQGDWMTENWVPFNIEFTFPDQPAGSRGTIVMLKDNPSGMPENDDSVEIPVMF
jgi:hypothetical protein